MGSRCAISSRTTRSTTSRTWKAAGTATTTTPPGTARLQRLRFFRGARPWDSSLKDLAWFRPDGRETTEADWQSFVRSLAFLLGGDAIDTPDERGIRILGDTLLVVMNAHHEVVQYRLPPVY